MAQRTAIYAGSFDPLTQGHIDIVKRGQKLFDRVIVAVGVNTAKDALFTHDERLDILENCLADLERVRVATFSGLLIEFAREQKACAIIRGLRAVTDFDYEFQIGLANMDLDRNIETVFFLTEPKNIFVSSSLVKEIARFGGKTSRYMAPYAEKALRRKMKELGFPEAKK